MSNDPADTLAPVVQKQGTVTQSRAGWIALAENQAAKEDVVSTALRDAIAGYDPKAAAKHDIQGLKYLSLPSRNVLTGLDVRFFQLLESRAVWGLKNLFIPVIWVFIARKRRLELIRERRLYDVTHSGITNILRNSDVFKLWPEKALLDLAAKAIPWAFSRGEIIFHEREQCFSIVIFISGKATVATSIGGEKGMKEMNARQGCNYEVQNTITAGRITGEYAVLSEELKMWLKADEHSSVFFIKNDDFIARLEHLPQAVRHEVSKSSLVKRRLNMLAKRMAPQALKASFLLKYVPLLIANEVVNLFKEIVVPRGTLVCEQGGLGKFIYYIAQGTCDVTVGVGGGKELTVAKLKAGHFFGELSIWYSQPMSANVRTTSVCEMWGLGKKDIHEIKAVLLNAGEREEVDEETKRKRKGNALMARASNERNILKYVRNVPMLALLDEDGLQELLPLFEPEVYLLKDIIASKSRRCDRLIIITAGTATRLDDFNQSFPPGSFFGATCLLCHRWGFTIVANSFCDIWSISQRSLASVLVRRQRYNTAVRQTMLQLQPMIDDSQLPPFDAALPRPVRARVEALEGRLRLCDATEVASTSHPVSMERTKLFPRYAPPSAHGAQKEKKARRAASPADLLILNASQHLSAQHLHKQKALLAGLSRTGVGGAGTGGLITDSPRAAVAARLAALRESPPPPPPSPPSSHPTGGRIRPRVTLSLLALPSAAAAASPSPSPHGAARRSALDTEAARVSEAVGEWAAGAHRADVEADAQAVLPRCPTAAGWVCGAVRTVGPAARPLRTPRPPRSASAARRKQTRRPEAAKRLLQSVLVPGGSLLQRSALPMAPQRCAAVLRRRVPLATPYAPSVAALRLVCDDGDEVGSRMPTPVRICSTPEPGEISL